MGSRRRAILSLLLVMLLPLAACDDDAPITPPADTPPASVRWTRVNGGLGQDSVYAAWVSPIGRTFIAGNRGIIHNENYVGWALESLPRPGTRIRSLCGTTLGPDRIYAVGDGGVIFERRAGAWFEMASPVTTRLSDVTGLSASSVYACGAGDAPGTGVILHFDGSTWTAAADAPRELFGAWAVSDSVVFVAGAEGYFARLDGDSLITIPPDHGVDLYDVWARSADEVYACGDQGVVLLYTGGPAELLRSGGPALRSVSGYGNAVFFAGDEGTLLFHYAGSDIFDPAATGLEDPMVSVGGYSQLQALAFGRHGSLQHYEYGTWTVVHAGSPNTLRSVAYDIIVGAAPTGGVAVVGTAEWSFPEALWAVTAFTPMNAYAVGDAGALYHFDQDDWIAEDIGTTADLRGITGLVSRLGEPLRMYAVGSGGTVRVWKSGASWSAPVLPSEAAAMDFVDVWAAAIDDVFAVASNSTMIARWDDPYEAAPWTVEPTPASAPLVAVGGWRTDTYAASAAGELLHHDAGGWKKIGVPGSITDIRGVSETAFYAVGKNGALRYYEAGRWSNFTPNYFGDFSGVWVRSGWSAVAVGENGAVWVHRTQ